MYGLLPPAGVDPTAVELLERFAEQMVMVVARAYDPDNPEQYEEGAEEDVREELRYFLRYEADGVPATPLQRTQRRARRGKTR